MWPLCVAFSTYDCMICDKRTIIPYIFILLLFFFSVRSSTWHSALNIPLFIFQLGHSLSVPYIFLIFAVGAYCIRLDFRNYSIVRWFFFFFFWLIGFPQFFFLVFANCVFYINLYDFYTNCFFNVIYRIKKYVPVCTKGVPVVAVEWFYETITHIKILLTINP